MSYPVKEGGRVFQATRTTFLLASYEKGAWGIRGTDGKLLWLENEIKYESIPNEASQRCMQLCTSQILHKAMLPNFIVYTSKIYMLNQVLIEKIGLVILHFK